MDLGDPRFASRDSRDGPVRLEEGRPFTLDTALARKRARWMRWASRIRTCRGMSAPAMHCCLPMDRSCSMSPQSKARASNAGTPGRRAFGSQGLNRQGGESLRRRSRIRTKDDIRFGAEQRIDYIAVSFARDATDISRARAMVRGAGGAARIVAKNRASGGDHQSRRHRRGV